tara:strand:- start:229 stop:1203 length:975 start_codon:yes stop_codon:yes gene_type:complete
MKKIINKISDELKDELILYNDCLKESLNSDVRLINTVLKYVMKTKGKQFRPILCILSSKLDGDSNDSTYISAATVEMLHVATLLHDDVVDEADFRRKWPTINTIWKSKLSILIGDYMFSRALNNIVKLKNIESMQILANISDRLSKGEILQIEKSIKKNMSEEIYFKMISDKTASLISASCKLGIMSVGNSSKKENLERFGEFLGIAYQLKDDLFDVLGKIDDTGKPTNLDLKKNILTLPYIKSLNSLNPKDKKNIISKLKYYSKRKEINEIKKIIVKNGGVEYTEKKIAEYSEKALKELGSFSDSIYKELMIEMVNFNLIRKH